MALGAKGVGLGKPAVYSMSAYGQIGIEKMLQILREELEKCMRLCGVTRLDQVRFLSFCARFANGMVSLTLWLAT